MTRPLGKSELHVWSVVRRPVGWPFASDLSLLSASEQQRADRYIDSVARDRYVAGRLITRHALASYLDEPPAAIGFDISTHGKPRLGKRHCRSGIRFNLSHSGDVVLLGVAQFEIGVDVEAVRKDAFTADLIGRVFDAQERACIAASQDPELACFCLWTRKEACAKATGMGLVGLKDLNALAHLCIARDPEGNDAVLHCCDVPLYPHYVAAIAAYAAGDVQIVHREWDAP